MSLAEPMSVTDGWQPVRSGLTRANQRDPGEPLHWQGLGVQDVDLLVSFVSRWRPPIEVLHTDVELGLCPEIDGVLGDDRESRLLKGMYALRVDACFYLDGDVYVCEVKPDAGYVAMGQVIVYRHFGRKYAAGLENCMAAVVTDSLQPGFAEVFEENKVRVLEVGVGQDVVDSWRSGGQRD